MENLVSIIIPVYNRQVVLRDCVNSILKQSYQTFEIILIDDGSSDHTLEVCRDLEKEDARITLLTMEHMGVSAARNKGLDAAKGELVFFVDSDDVIHPLLLETLVLGLKNSDAGIAGSGIMNIPESKWHSVSEKMERDPGPGETTYQDHQDTLKAVFHTTTPINLIGGVMMHRDLIGETRFRTDLHIGEDFYFIYENLIKGTNSVFLKQRWYYCRLHANNSSWDYSYAGFWTRFYRRELVWKSEEAFGRMEYANCQKRNAFGIFLDFLKRNGWHSTDSKKMRKAVKAYRGVLFPALTHGEKAKYILAVYIPPFYLSLVRVKQKLKKVRERMGKL